VNINSIFIFNSQQQVGPQRATCNKRERVKANAIDIHSTRNEINPKIKKIGRLHSDETIKFNRCEDHKEKRTSESNMNRVSTVINKVSTV
jgi:hypothetical protein